MIRTGHWHLVPVSCFYIWRYIMIATVKAYYNTGLTVGNSLDDITQLDALGFSSHSFPNIAIKQDRGRINIKINTDYSTIKDADYVKINDVGYWVTGITMLNDNVAAVGLQQDYVTTVGTTGLEVISGWCIRKHVITQQEDEIYYNTLDEPFQPTNRLEIDFGNEITGAGTAGASRVVVVSSIDLTSVATLESKAYLDSTGDKVLVPQLPVCSNSATTYVSHIVNANGNQAKVPMTQAYAGNDATILQALSTVRSLGVESCIVACYNVPSEWVDQGGISGSMYTQLHDNSRNVSSAFNSQWGSYKNKKVYSGQFQRIVVYSLASGESSENRVEDIISPSNTISWFVAADPRFNGNPICRPLYYHKSENTKLMGTVNGAKWQQTPITYQGASGYEWTRRERDISLQRASEVAGLGILNNALGMFTGGAAHNINMQEGGGPEGAIGAIGSATGIMNDISSYAYRHDNLNLQLARQLSDVDMQFPRVPSFQDYIGNNFYEMRYRLSDNDMTRFDNFLTAFGYAVDEELKTECFGGRTHFNYVQARDVALKKSGAPQYLLDGMAKTIESGVRIWHTAPAHSKLLDNPIA